MTTINKIETLMRYGTLELEDNCGSIIGAMKVWTRTSERRSIMVQGASLDAVCDELLSRVDAFVTACSQ